MNMQVVKIILIVTVIAQISLGMPMSASFGEGNINGELIQEIKEEPKDVNLETEQVLQAEEAPENLSSETGILSESEQTAPQVDDQQPSFTMTKNLPMDLGKLPIENPTEILSSLPDLQKMQRDQLFTLAMAQFMQYVQSVVHESEAKLPSILRDFTNTKNMNIENQMESIEKCLKQIDDYKTETKQFVKNTFKIPEIYENLLDDLKSTTMENFEMQQILQNYDLNNYEKYIGNYMDALKQIADYQIKSVYNDFNALGNDSQETLNKLYKNLLNESELKNYVENLSNLFKF